MPYEPDDLDPDSVSSPPVSEAPPAMPAPPEDSGSPWYSSIEDASLRRSAEKFREPGDLLKSYVELERRFSKSVTPPGPDATADEILAYRKRVGIPETRDGYAFELPTGSEASPLDREFQVAMAEAFHETGITAQQAKALNAAFNGFSGSLQERTAAENHRLHQQAAEQAETRLRQEWGQDFNLNARYAHTACAKFFPDDLAEIELKDGTLLGSHPAFLRGLSEIGKRATEGGMELGRMMESSGSNLMELADHLRAKRNEARAAGDDASVRRFDAEERAVLARIYGDDPVPGAVDSRL
ncbi:MAG: hypothetical protein RIM72_00650 [Alphaproteobacteria bacterium]